MTKFIFVRMKTLLFIFAFVIVIASSSCKRVFVCGCSLYQTTPDSVNVYTEFLSHRFKAYKPDAKDYCEKEFADSLNRQFGVTNTQCLVNGGGM